MNIPASPALTIDPDVHDFLKRHAAEAAFQAECDVVRECFPEAERVEVRLFEDPEEDRTWAVFHVYVPAGYSPDRLQEQRLLHHEKAFERIPLEHRPLFGTLLGFAAGAS
jgi:hypothetical protein